MKLKTITKDYTEVVNTIISPMLKELKPPPEDMRCILTKVDEPNIIYVMTLSDLINFDPSTDKIKSFLLCQVIEK